MKKFLSISFLSLSLALVACTDTSGLSKESSRGPKGNPDAAVIVTEYADLQCPACRSAYDSITKPLLEKYATQIRFDYKHFPLRSIHMYAIDLAEAAECSADQGKFWEYVDIAFQRQPELKSSAMRQWATELGLDMQTYDRCTKSHIKRDTILADYAAGDKAGVAGTPTYFVNGVKVESTLSAISAAIDSALSGAAQRL